MPSHLRIQQNFTAEPIEAHATYHTSTSQRPTKKAKMSLTQTYYVASSARSKLGKEASRADHNLRRLVGHANLLDQLMVDLADAERESENWLNQSIREASRPEEPRHVQWMDSIAEDMEDDCESDDESDDGSEADESEIISLPANIKSAPVTISSDDFEEDEDAEYDDDSEEEELALRRVASQHSPPELTLDDSDSESEDEEEDFTPKSPENTVLELSEKQRQAITTTAFYDLKSQQGIEDYIIQQQQPLIAAC